MLSIYRSGEIDLFENLDIVHIRLLVVDAVMRSSFKEGSYLRLVDFFYHSTLGRE